MNQSVEEVEPCCSVHGVGSVECEGHVFTNITYMIECWQRAEDTTSMCGLLDADWKTAVRIRRARENVLILNTGDEVAVTVVGSEAGTLKIQVLDPVKTCMMQSDLKKVVDFR